MNKIVEQTASVSEIAGIGMELIKLKNEKSGEVLAYIGQIDKKECVSFTKPISFDDLISVAEIVQKKKFNKAIIKNEFDKAEGFINKKFNHR